MPSLPATEEDLNLIFIVGVVGTYFYDFVHQLHRVTVRQKFADAVYIHNRFAVAVIEIGANYIVGVKNVTSNEPFFQGHFPQEPVMPGVLQIEAMAQTGGLQMCIRDRFQHSLGAFYLMSEAIQQLATKGNFIFDSEAEAVEAAILMHDIGHGPFSHVLENTIVQGVSHEDISLMLMERINKEMNGQLTLAIQIFKDEYPKRFLHQLVSGQLDMDRLDYLRRDSFYTGVTEGNIGSARIIKMLDVKDDHLVVESKGIYSIENFLTARRLMYWQVYLHKTSVAYEKMLISTLLRAKELASRGIDLFASPALKFFLYNDISREAFYNNPECLENFIQLDDNDIWTALKVWSRHSDKVLSTLSAGMINRNIFKVEISTEPISEERKKELTLQISEQLNIPLSEARYFISTPSIEKKMYDEADDSIDILYNDGSIKNIAEASDMLNISLLSKKVKKYYLCYQRLHR